MADRLAFEDPDAVDVLVEADVGLAQLVGETALLLELAVGIDEAVRFRVRPEMGHRGLERTRIGVAALSEGRTRRHENQDRGCKDLLH